MPSSEPAEAAQADARPLVEIAGAFLRLGLIAFGGPIAHLGYLRDEFVLRRRYLDDRAYADLVALCQFLPGPTSSQVVFALGMHRAGIVGAIVASLCFLAPSALLMIGLAYGIAAATDLAGSGWIQGLKLAAVAVVGHAIAGMWRTLCSDWATRALCLLAAALLIALPGATTQIAVVAGGLLAGSMLLRGEPLPAPERLPRAGSHRVAVALIALFLLLLAGLPVAAAASGSRPLALFDLFYRAGSLVFGGGHVVLPLLRDSIVPRGWVGDDAFLAGYGAAQALPGPLFAFAGYIGTLAWGDGRAWIGGVLGLGAIFLPGWLLVAGVLPFWERLRAAPRARAALRGAGAVVVGLLLAALCRPIIAESVHGPVDALIALAAFGLLRFAGAPPVLIVALCALAGAASR